MKRISLIVMFLIERVWFVPSISPARGMAI